MPTTLFKSWVKPELDWRRTEADGTVREKPSSGIKMLWMMMMMMMIHQMRFK